MHVARAALADVIRHFEHHAEVASTNDRGMALARDEQIVLPALIVADRQTAGRGRGANRWWSADGALTFSLVVDLVGDQGAGSRRRGSALGKTGSGTRPVVVAESPVPSNHLPVPSNRWPLVALTAGMAVCDALRPLAPSVPMAIKWPNDVYAAGRKLCGILVETSATPAGRVVIGIGVNVNNTFAAAPDDVRSRATSLVELSGRPLDLDAVLTAIVGELIDLLPTIAATPPAVIERWPTYCLLTGQAVEVQTPAGTSTGLCEGVDADGALLLRDEVGKRRCTTGTVVRWGPG